MSLNHLRRSRAFRFAIFLGLWAMLLPALLPLVHPQASVAMGAMPANCPMLMGGGAHHQTPDHGKAQTSCPICQGLQSIAHGFVPPDVAALAGLQPLRVAVAAKPQAQIPFTLRVAAWPRGPPSLA